MDAINNTRIFFIGVTEFGLACFNKLTEMGCNIVGCTYTEENIIVSRQKNGMKNVTFIDFKEIAKKNNIRGIFYDKTNPNDYEAEVIKMNPELIIVAGFHYLLSSKITSYPRIGTVGMHSSLLPKYRGGSPLTWQIINDERISGLTMFYIGEGTDTGDIIAQESFEIEESDTIKDLIVKSQAAAVNLLDVYVPMLLNGTAPQIKQNEEDASYYRLRIPADGRINWNDTPKNIKNFIRAQTKPYPGAFTHIQGKKVVIWDADIIEE